MWKRLYLESSVCISKNGKKLESINDDSVVKCGEIVDANADGEAKVNVEEAEINNL